MARRELRIIRDGLHCNVVRVMGGDPQRLELVAGLATDLGLQVWFSPFPLELTVDETLALFADSAFVFTFALYDFPHRPDGDPRDDLDLASYSIVKVFDDGRLEPKAAFAAVAEHYSLTS